MGEYIFKDSVYDELVIQSAIKNRRIILNEEVTEQSMQKLRLLLLKIKKIMIALKYVDRIYWHYMVGK